MKRWIAGMLAALLMLAIAGCGQETQADPLIQVYKETAQKYIAAGEIDKAVVVLEDGLLKTNQNSELAAMLEQVKAQQPTQEETPTTDTETAPTEVETIEFAGYWEGENYYMHIEEQEEKLQLFMVCYSEYYDEYVVESSVDIAEVKETKASFPFDDDGYGSTGKVVLYLEENTLNYVITDFVTPAEDGEDPYGIGVGCGGGSLQRVDKMPEVLELFEEHSEETSSDEDDDKANPTDEDDIYVGDWGDYISERATMSIVKTAGKYSIKIEWTDSASETTVWTMTAVEKQEDEDCWLESTDCKKVVTEYSEDGFVSKEVEYENGKAMIFYMDETLNWVDYTEYAGDDCCFERIS